MGSEHLTLAITLNNLALLYQAQGQYAQAEPLYQRALALWEKALGPEHPLLVISLHSLVLLYQSQGHEAQAEPLYRRALAILEEDSLAGAPLLLPNLNLVQFYQQALVIWENAPALDPPFLLNIFTFWRSSIRFRGSLRRRSHSTSGR